MLGLILISFLVFNTPNAAITVAEETVTIVELEGKSYLAHVDASGNVIHKYMEVSEATISESNPETRIAKAKEEYEALREREKDQIRFLAYDFLADVVQPIAMNHINDLTDHYNESYANQIVITLGKRPGNEEFLKEKEDLIVTALTKLNVPRADIEVKYKWDRGPEPTEFIKINTTLRELATL